ncbi:S49 family peptidase, partial [Myxococcota bacterium]
VVCHAHTLSNATTWLAGRGCDRVWLSPAGGVDAVGIAAQVLYLRALFDKLKVRADYLAIGKYKSAAEGYTREGPSEEARVADPNPGVHPFDLAAGPQGCTPCAQGRSCRGAGSVVCRRGQVSRPDRCSGI